MQETFLAVYKGLEEFDREREQAWICRIAVDKSLDFLMASSTRLMVMYFQGETPLNFLKSAERRQVPVEEVFSDVEPAEAKEVPEQVYLKKESEEAVRVLCESLKEPYGSVAVAHFYEGKTAREISEVTGQGLKTVQTHIYRAKLMLKSKLERSRDDSYG